MSISAAFTFSGVVTPLAKKSVAAATVFTATIDDLSGVASVEWAIIGTDGATEIGDYTAVASGPKGSVYTITSLTAFTGGLVQATVRNGDFVDVQRALFYVPSTVSSLEPLIFNEWFESDSAAAYVAKANAATLAFDAASGFNPQATTVNIATGAVAGTTNVGTRAGEAVNVGPVGGSDTSIRGLVALDGGGNDVVCEATNWETTASAAFYVIADSFQIDAQAGGATLSSAATPATAVASVVKLKGDVGVSIGAGATDPATPASGRVLIAGDTVHAVGQGSVEVRSDNTGNVSLITASGDIVLASADVLTVEATTGMSLRADGPPGAPSTGDCHIRGAGVSIRAGGVPADPPADQVLIRGTTIELTGTLTNNGSPIGGGTSISQAGGSVAVDGSGGIAGATAADQAISMTAANTGATASATLSLDGANGEASLATVGAGQIEIASGATGSVALKVGASARSTLSVSGANLRTVHADAGGATALTTDLDNAACSHTYVGTLTESCATQWTITCTGGEVEINATTLDVNLAGSQTLDCTNYTGTLSGTYAVTAGGNANLTASNTANINGAAGGTLGSFSGPVDVRPGDRSFDVTEYLTSAARIRTRIPAAVTPGSGAATAIGTLPVPASTTGRFVGVLTVRNGSGNSKSFDLDWDWNADGTTVTSRNLNAVATAVQGTIGTVAGDVTLGDAALVTTLNVANASGFRCSLTGAAHINQ